MRFPLLRSTGVLALAFAIASCSDTGLLEPTPVQPSFSASAASGGVVISQVYGGGGNSGAVYKNDFVELFNAGATEVSLEGWSVQYASAAGTTWQVTRLSGRIAPGGHFLVQQAAGTGGTTALPAAEVVGAIPMSGTDGKVALVGGATALSGSCPAGVVDFVGYGTANCFEGAATPKLSNTTAALRKAVCVDTNRNVDDFVLGAPKPRNSASGTTSCEVIPVGPVTSVTVTSAQVLIGAARQMVAAAADSAGRTATTTYAWTSSNPAVAAIDANTGIVTGVAEGTVTITATSANGIEGTATLQVTVPGGVSSISISVNSPFSVPAGYTKPAFPTARDAEGRSIFPAPKYAWTSSDEAIATVDSLGYITGTGPGRVTIRATAPNGVFGTTTLTILPATAPTSAIYRNHLEFGVPAGGTAGLLQEKSQFAASYNSVRGGPNWVSWNLNASQFGTAPRCDCFSADQTLPSSVTRVVDFDYRNGGYDRGHMVQSESRTTTDQENASTFLLTNILPQAGENNQGPWSQFENYLNGLARTNGKEVYVIAGGLYAENAPTLKNEGKVAIPDYTWKVAVVMDGGKGVANVTSTGDVQVFAIKMPNLTTPSVPASAVGIRNTPWQQYAVTVDQIERETGYDLLGKLPNQVEVLVESGTRAPVASAGGTYTVTEGTAVAFDASGSTDPDGDALTYAWDFGDGTTGTGVNPRHVYADNGVYQARVTVTDAVGAEDVATASVTVVNVAPAVHVFAGASLMTGETFTGSTSFTDPGADQWTATVDYGDGSGAQPVSISGRGIQLSHRYTRAGSFTVTVTVRDQDGEAGTQSARVTVQTAAQGIDGLDALVSTLARTGSLNRGNANALSATLRAASASLARGDETPAMNQLEAFINQVEALAGNDRLSDAEAKGMIDAANRILRSIRA